MQKLLKKEIAKAKFHPGILGFFINNNYLIRVRLRKAIKKNSSLLNGSLLDFGCGTKPYVLFFSHVKKYTGIDLKIEGREENQRYVDVFYDGVTLPFESERFDSILCTEVLEHVFNIEELLKEFSRVLKPGGKALITTPFMWEEHEIPYDYARYTTFALLHIYKQHGFKVVKNYKTGNYIEVIFQFQLNYLKNILPRNKYLKQLLLIPFITLFNILGIVLGTLLPKDQTAYFNNVFILEKK